MAQSSLISAEQIKRCLLSYTDWRQKSFCAGTGLFSCSYLCSNLTGVKYLQQPTVTAVTVTTYLTVFFLTKYISFTSLLTLADTWHVFCTALA